MDVREERIEVKQGGAADRAAPARRAPPARDGGRRLAGAITRPPARRRARRADGDRVSGLLRSEAALPVAYGLMLPVAFISEVFFPAPGEAAWLRSVAAALPVAPFAHAMESAFAVPPHGMTGGQLGVLLAWGVGAAVVAIFTFRWEPGGLRRQRARARSSLR